MGPLYDFRRSRALLKDSHKAVICFPSGRHLLAEIIATLHAGGLDLKVGVIIEALRRKLKLSKLTFRPCGKEDRDSLYYTGQSVGDWLPAGRKGSKGRSSVLTPVTAGT